MGMHQQLSESRLANVGGHAIHVAFDTYQRRFAEVTLRARERFGDRDWNGLQADASERLDLYKGIVDEIEATIRSLLQDKVSDKLIWASMKAVYSGLIVGRDDWELAETFFNSVTRRIFTTVGVDPRIEFVTTDFETPPTQAGAPVYRTYDSPPRIEGLIEGILRDFDVGAAIAHSARDVALVAREVRTHLHRLGAPRHVDAADVVSSVFFRGQRAYIVGRLLSGPHVIPLVLALTNGPSGAAVDAVLLDEQDVSILFSYTRSYFHVHVERPYDLVRFLKTLVPRKRDAELYIAIGYNKHGKTELYRNLLRHLATSTERFESADGTRGMVMNVFTLPGYDVVFKIIKDRFPRPKQTSRGAIMGKYHLVFRHDRAGRLIDAQEFEHLKFDRDRFTDDLLEQLCTEAARTVSIEGDQVVIRHAYVERRVVPLDLYIRDSRPEAARIAVVDFGNTIKDLAATNIFPGDLLLKNFGVTRQGRVVFYDYDELCWLLDCTFRRLPPSDTYEDDLRAEPWFGVGPNDIFPEELRHFLGLPDPLREVFEEHHGDLFDVGYWRGMQERLERGEIIEIVPYHRGRALRR